MVEHIWGGVFLVIAVAAYVHIVAAMRTLHLSTNSRLDELLKTTKALSRAEGFTAGQEAERAERFGEIERAGHTLDKSHE
jgi:hypothetical protein